MSIIVINGESISTTNQSGSTVAASPDSQNFSRSFEQNSRLELVFPLDDLPLVSIANELISKAFPSFKLSQVLWHSDRSNSRYGDILRSPKIELMFPDSVHPWKIYLGDENMLYRDRRIVVVCLEVTNE